MALNTHLTNNAVSSASINFFTSFTQHIGVSCYHPNDFFQVGVENAIVERKNSKWCDVVSDVVSNKKATEFTT